MKKYIIHYPVLKDRKDYLQKLIDFDQLRNVIWISKWPRENGMEKLKNLEPKYIPSPEDWSSKCKNYYNNMPPYREMKVGDISCFLNHFNAWEEIAKNGDGLILEDDAIFCDDFENKLDAVVKSSPKFDVLFIGGLYPHEDVSKTISVNGNFYLKSHPSTNTVCAYILKQNSAIKLVSAVKRYNLPVDFELNYWFDELNFEIYHHIPYLVKEGSGSGKFKSSQSRETQDNGFKKNLKKLFTLFNSK
jgi:GR25 family glycosyltransferase involved in LPS biosynthesis